MTIWSFRAAAVAAALALGGCGEGGSLPGMKQVNLLSGLGTKQPKTTARMSGGALTLVAPEGYCIDPQTKRASFVLMARCDVLNEAAESAGAPLGLIAVSITPSDESGVLPTPDQIAKSKGLGAPSRVRRDAGQVIFRTTGPILGKGLDRIHWRGAALVNGQVLGIALYGPESSRAVSSEGAQIIDALIKRTRTAK